MKKFLKRFVIITALLTAALWITNKVIFVLALVKELLPTKEGHYYQWKEGRMFYKKQGSGRPLILIHDLQTDSSGYEWNRIEGELSKEYTVYTLDLLGCGRSDKPAINYSSYFYVQQIESFLKNVVGGSASIAATGTSGSYVLLAASQNLDLIDHIVLINPQSFQAQSYIPTTKTKAFQTVLSVPVFGTALYNYSVRLAKIRQKLSTESFYCQDNCTKKDVYAYYEAAHTKGAAAKFLYGSIVSGFVNMPVSHILSKLTMPITIIGGEMEDGKKEIMAQYKEKLPKIQLETISNTKHLPQLEAPAEVIKAMHAALSR